MSRHDLDPATFAKWAQGEIDNRHARTHVEHPGGGDRGLNALGIVMLIVIALVLINIPTIFRALVAIAPEILVTVQRVLS